MKGKCLPALLVILAAGSLLGSRAAERGPSTPEERAKAIEFTRSLETEPLSGDAAEKRRWLTEWLIEVPDISVKVCTDLIEPALARKYPYGAEVGLHPMFASAVFVIQNPDQAKNENALYLAGLEGALRVYEVLVKSKPDAKLKGLDELLATRDRGELAAYVEKVAGKKCKS